MWKLLCRIGLHRRDKRQRFRDQDGLIKSRCRGCGLRMVREGVSGRWLAYAPREREDRRVARRKALAGPLQQLTAPVLFAILLAAFVALTLLVRGTYDGWK